MKRLRLLNSKRIIALGLSGLFAVIYLTGVPKTAVNVADSDDLSLAGFTQSLTHPPGYNLLTAFLSVGKVLPPTYFALFTHASSALVQSANVGLFFLVVAAWLALLKLKQSSSMLIAVVGSLWWGLNRLTYQNAVIVEVFPLATLLLLLFLYFLAAPKSNHPLKLGVLAALALFAHQLTLLVTGVALVAQLVQTKTQASRAKIIGSFAAGVATLLATYWLYFDTQTLFGWYIEPNLSGVMKFVTRATLKGGSAIEVYATTLDLHHSLHSLIRLAELVSRQGSLVLIPLAAYGWWVLKTRTKKIATLLGIPIVLFVLLFTFYLKLPLIDTSLSDTQFFWGMHLTERMLFGLSLVLHLLATLGLAALLSFRACRGIPSRWLYTAGISLSVDRQVDCARDDIKARGMTLNLVLMCVVLIAGCFALRSNRAYQQFSTSDFSQRYSHHLLSVLPEHAVVVVDTDIVFGLLYAQIIESVRPDVSIVPQVMGMRGSWFFAQSGELYELRVGDNELQAAEVVRFALETKRPVFIYHPSTTLLAHLAILPQPVEITPYDFWLEVSSDAKDAMLPPDTFAHEQLEKYPTSLWQQGWRGHLATLYAMQAYYLGKNGSEDLASNAATLGMRLAQLPQTKQAVQASLREGLSK